MTIKQNIVHHACDTAMHILYNSGLAETNLWPKKGFKAGHGIGCEKKDRIYFSANAFGWDKKPVYGRLGFNIWNTPLPRERKQNRAIRLILDYAYYNDLFFEDEFKSNFITDTLWFKFTYTPPTQ
jgi:hypothetical protein